MKTLILFALALFCMISCSQTPENKVSSLIRANIEKSLAHPDSYEAIETVVDSAFAPFDDPTFYQKTLEICLLNVEEMDDSLTKEVQKRIQELSEMMGLEYRFIGFKVMHRFSAKNGDGETFTGEKVYIMDKDMKKIIAQYNIESIDYIMVQTMYNLWIDESLSNHSKNDI